MRFVSAVLPVVVLFVGCAGGSGESQPAPTGTPVPGTFVFRSGFDRLYLHDTGSWDFAIQAGYAYGISASGRIIAQQGADLVTIRPGDTSVALLATNFEYVAAVLPDRGVVLYRGDPYGPDANGDVWFAGFDGGLAPLALSTADEKFIAAHGETFVIQRGPELFVGGDVLATTLEGPAYPLATTTADERALAVTGAGRVLHAVDVTGYGSRDLRSIEVDGSNLVGLATSANEADSEVLAGVVGETVIVRTDTYMEYESSGLVAIDAGGSGPVALVTDDYSGLRIDQVLRCNYEYFGPLVPLVTGDRLTYMRKVYQPADPDLPYRLESVALSGGAAVDHGDVSLVGIRCPVPGGLLVQRLPGAPLSFLDPFNGAEIELAAAGAVPVDVVEDRLIYDVAGSLFSVPITGGSAVEVPPGGTYLQKLLAGVDLGRLIVFACREAYICDLHLVSSDGAAERMILPAVELNATWVVNGWVVHRRYDDVTEVEHYFAYSLRDGSMLEITPPEESQGVSGEMFEGFLE